MKSHWKPAWTLILALVIGIRIVFGFLGAQIVGSGEPEVLAPGRQYDSVVALLDTDDFSRAYINPWLRWDTVWYLKIAAFGYDSGDGTVAFAPLYPLLIRAAGIVLGGNLLLAALLLSTLFSGISLILLYELFNKNLALIIAFLLFPTAFFLLAGYTESLFLLLVLATFLFARKKQWLWAGIFAGLSVLARFQGIVLGGVLFWLLIVDRLGIEELSPKEQVFSLLNALKTRSGWHRLFAKGNLFAWITAFIPPTVFYLYIFGLHIFGLGNPSAELARIWGISTVPPWTGFYLFFNRLISTSRVFIDWIDLSLFIFIITLAIYGLKYLAPSYSIYILGSLLMLFTRGTPPHLLDSFSRYMLMLFPLFSVITKMRSRMLQISLGGVAILLQLFLLMGFFDWRWIA